MNKFIKILLICIGSLSIAFGILGIFLPLLPTTPFLLLGAACYVKSSEKLYNRLITNKFLGDYIKNYREGKGIPFKAKIYSITLLWISIGYSTIFIVSKSLIRLIMITVAISVTWHILSVQTFKEIELEEQHLQEKL